MKRAILPLGTLLLAIAAARPFAVQPSPRLALEFEDYAALPITADNTNDNTRAQLARVNYLRDEPGGRRFFVNDLNGPLYILDKQTKAFTTYLDFNGAGGRPGLFPKFTFERNFATGLTNFLFDPDYTKNGVFYTLHMEDLGVRAPQSASAGLGHRPGASAQANAPGLQHRTRHVGNHRGHPQGRELRLSAARRHAEHVVHERHGSAPDEDTIPIQVSDTVTRGTVKPTYPVAQYSHSRETGGDAIANGFVYRGTRIPALAYKLVFGDITTGRLWYANRAEVVAADDGNPATVAPIYEIETDLRRLTEEKFRERGGKAQLLPGMAMVSGRGRVDLRFAEDNAGELYVLTKSDGMIRKVVSARRANAPESTARASTSAGGRRASDRPGAALDNPAMPTAASIAAGKRTYDALCAVCHGNLAQGAIKAGIAISIIEEQKGKQPPDLTDDAADHGSTDGDVFTVIKRGVPSTMMPGFTGQLTDDNVWNIVNYVRSLRLRK